MTPDELNEEQAKPQVEEVTPINPDLEHRFTYHAPKGNQTLCYERIRGYAKDFAYMINQMGPYSREQSLALTHLEEVVMWANAAIARNE